MKERLWRPARTTRNFVLTLIGVALWAVSTEVLLLANAVLPALILALGCAAGLYIMAIAL